MIKQDLPVVNGLAAAEQISDLAARLKPYAFDAKWDILSKEMIERCHQAGVKVFSDALGKHEKIEGYSKAMDWGIDLIQTDHPLRVMRAIELRFPEKPPISPKPQAAAEVKP